MAGGAGGDAAEPGAGEDAAQQRGVVSSKLANCAPWLQGRPAVNRAALRGVHAVSHVLRTGGRGCTLASWVDADIRLEVAIAALSPPRGHPLYGRWAPTTANLKWAGE